MSQIIPLRVPKWGLSMMEGTIRDWHVKIGQNIEEGDDLVDIETAKITNVAAAPAAGTLRRITVERDQTLPVGALIGIISGEDTSDAEIDTFIEDFNAGFVVSSANNDDTGISTVIVDTRFGGVRVGQIGDGDGIPVLFLHGFASSLESWAFTLDAFSDRTVVAIDLPGHGESTKDVGDGSIADLASAVEDVVKSLDIEEFDLVGHSLGAAVALQLGVVTSKKVRNLVLISPAGLGSHPVSAEFLDGIIKARRNRELRSVLEMLVVDPARITTEMVDNIVKFKRLDGVAQALTKMRDQIVDGSQFEKIRKASPATRLHVISGRDDRIVGVPGQDDLPEGSVLNVIGAAGHMPHIEQAAEVNEILRAALD